MADDDDAAAGADSRLSNLMTSFFKQSSSYWLEWVKKTCDAYHAS